MKTGADSIRHSLADVAATGFWWCRACESVSAPTDETAVDTWAKCERCHQAGTLEWKPPALASQKGKK